MVDNNSDDDSVDWIHVNYPDVNVIALSDNIGFGKANETGIRSTNSPFVALLNTDTEVEPNWLQVMIDCMRKDADIGSACSLLHWERHPELINAAGGGMTWIGYGYRHNFGMRHSDLKKDNDSSYTDVLFPTGAAMVMRRDLFIEIGGFDSAFFMYHEDVDLGWRIWLLGKRVVLCYESIVHHLDGGSSPSPAKQFFTEKMGLRHNIRTLIKCYELPLALKAIFVTLLMLLFRIRIRLMIHVVLWNLIKLPETLRLRKQIKKNRAIKTSELFDRQLIAPFTSFPLPVPADPPLQIPFKDQLASSILYPGADSGTGRLGCGWSTKLEIDSRPVRLFSGYAHCIMRVNNNQAGILKINFRVAHLHCSTRIRILCNNNETEKVIETADWQTINIPTDSASEGLLDIRLYLDENHTVKTFHRMQCAIHLFEFIPVDSQTSFNGYSTATVVIPHYNKGSLIHDTLQALNEQTRLPDEVIIVDDGSDSESLKQLFSITNKEYSFPVTVIEQKHAGPAEARNCGFHNAKSELILFIGDDIMPDSNWLQQHIAAQQKLGPNHAVCGFTTWDTEGMNVTPLLKHVNSNGEQFGYGHFKDKSELPFTCLYTSNISIPRNLLMLHSFDPWFRDAAWEDCELGYRLCNRGMRIIYDINAATKHCHPMDALGFCRRHRKAGRIFKAMIKSRWPYFTKHFHVPSDRKLKFLYNIRFLLIIAEQVINIWDKAKLPLPAVAYRYFLGWEYATGMAEYDLNYKNDQSWPMQPKENS